MIENRGMELFEFLDLHKKGRVRIPENVVIFEAAYKHQIHPLEYKIHLIKECLPEKTDEMECSLTGKITSVSFYTTAADKGTNISPDFQTGRETISFVKPDDFSYVFILFPENLTTGQFKDFLRFTFKDEGCIKEEEAENLAASVLNFFGEIPVSGIETVT